MPKLKNYQKFTERAVFHIIQSVIAHSPLREFLVIFDSEHKPSSTNILLILQKTIVSSERRQKF